MLTSSDAKFRCLWYMVVWSVLLMIVSQFFRLIDHIAFYVFSAAAMLLLPLVTSIYSTTGGRHGAGLLRVSYIFCDPVLACVTVIPILLLSRLPRHIDDFSCLLKVDTSNLTSSIAVHCSNQTSPHIIADLYRSPDRRSELMDGIRHQIGIIQGYLLAPSLLTLAMGRRSRKMSFATIAAVACYWMFTSIETADLLNIDIVAMATARRNAVISTAAIVAIAMIIINSYAVVTLCSYICPSDATTDRPVVVGSKRSSQFDKLYRILMGVAGVMFAEVPLLAARGQVISLDLRLPAVFYIWAVKDSVLIAVALVTVVYHTLGARRGIISATCGRMAFDNPDVFFLPEKRDAYIVRHQYYPHRFSDGIDVGGDGGRNRCESVLLAPDVVDRSTSVSSSSHGNGSPSKKSKRVTFHFDLHHHHSRSHRTGDNVELDVVTSDNNSGGGGGRNDCLSRGNVFKSPPLPATAAVPNNGVQTRNNDGDVANVNSALRQCDGDNDDIGNNMAAAAAAAEVDVYCQQQTDLSIAFNKHEMDLMLKPENGLLEHRNITAAAADASAVMNLSDCDSDDNACETKVAIS